MQRKFYIANFQGIKTKYATIDTALEMINKWLDEGEVSGTDHYIGPGYDPEEYLNLMLINSILRDIRNGG